MNRVVILIVFSLQILPAQALARDRGFVKAWRATARWARSFVPIRLSQEKSTQIATLHQQANQNVLDAAVSIPRVVKGLGPGRIKSKGALGAAVRGSAQALAWSALHGPSADTLAKTPLPDGSLPILPQDRQYRFQVLSQMGAEAKPQWLGKLMPQALVSARYLLETPGLRLEKKLRLEVRKSFKTVAVCGTDQVWSRVGAAYDAISNKNATAAQLKQAVTGLDQSLSSMWRVQQLINLSGTRLTLPDVREMLPVRAKLSQRIQELSE